MNEYLDCDTKINMTAQDVLYVLKTEKHTSATTLSSTSKLKPRPVFRLTQGQKHKKGGRPCLQTIPSRSKQSSDP